MRYHYNIFVSFCLFILDFFIKKVYFCLFEGVFESSWRSIKEQLKCFITDCHNVRFWNALSARIFLLTEQARDIIR